MNVRERDARRIMTRMAEAAREVTSDDQPLDTREFNIAGGTTVWWAMLWPVALELARLEAVARDPRL